MRTNANTAIDLAGEQYCSTERTPHRCPQPPVLFSKTEARRRLAKLAREVRRRNGFDPRIGRVEVGLRNIRIVGTDFTDLVTAGWYDPHDDLYEWVDLDNAADLDDVREQGSVVHLYLSASPYGRPAPEYEYELVSVCCGWIGTKDAEPVLLDTDGSPRSIDWNPSRDGTVPENEPGRWHTVAGSDTIAVYPG